MQRRSQHQDGTLWLRVLMFSKQQPQKAATINTSHIGGLSAPPIRRNMDWNEVPQHALAILSTATPAQWCQAFFLLAAGAVLAVAAMPRDAKTLLVDYGARKAPTAHANKSSTKSPHSGWLLSLIASLTSWTQVPHAWFSAFYVVSLACSVFWLAQYLGNGAILSYIVSSQASGPEPSATLGQAAFGWLMMFLQGARRVFEHATIVKTSKSTMWVVHWLLGLLFYLSISVAVWVEGSGMASSLAETYGTDLLTAAQAPSWTRRPAVIQTMPSLY